MEVNERTVVGGLIGHCVPPPNRGERSTRMYSSISAEFHSGRYSSSDNWFYFKMFPDEVEDVDGRRFGLRENLKRIREIK